MEAKTIKKNKDMICQKMDEMARMNALSNSDIEKQNMLIVSYEKLLKIEEMEGIGEYSQGMYSRDGRWVAEGSYGRGNSYNSYGDNSYGYDDGMSGARTGTHYVRGHYSRAEASDMTRDHIRKMMSEGNMSESDRRTLERAMEII